MNRRKFLTTATIGSAAALPLAGQNYSGFYKGIEPTQPLMAGR